MKLGTLMGAAAIAGTAFALTAGVATAAPAANGAALFICRDVQNPNNYRIAIKGTYPMQEPDAYGYLKHVNDGPQQGGMDYRLVADDEGSNDPSIYSGFIPGTRNDNSGFVRTSPGGIEYRREFSIPRTAFDEDSQGDADELYATATFVDGDGGRRTHISQVITRNFEAPGVCDGCCQ